ncbi:hypothetical protein Cgig2_010223 [Carnegiea gigantea]|uniref:Uncharacterized protein n=1 Tax=Carnegiea gigantea TaxID=171969 RepID=A0A9Q1Q7L7_9CARY|nr:hypothetical protein Cgig2_010223 [Carnegiea gigantea]
MFDKLKRRKRIKFVIMERKRPTMIDKLLFQLDESLGGMNIDGNVMETLLTGNQPMSSKEAQQSQVNDDPTDDFWDQIMGKIDESQLQSTLVKPHKKDVMVNDEDGESKDEDDDQFEGKSIGSDGLENIESDGLEKNYSDGFVIDENQIFDSGSGEDDKWERMYEGRFWEPENDTKAYSSVNYNKAIESLHKESPTAYTWAMEVPIEH